MQDGMFSSANIHINRTPRLERFLAGKSLVIIRIRIPQEVPARINEGVHGFCFRRPALTKDFFYTILQLLGFRQRRFAGWLKRNVVRQLPRQVLIRHRMRLAVRIVDNRNWRTPVPLPPNRPVLEFVGCFFFTKLFSNIFSCSITI